MFNEFHNVNMDLLSTSDTLDPAWFKADSVFKEAYKEAAKDDDNKACDAFDDDDFAHECWEYALSTGKGFHKWLYKTFSYIRAALSPKIQKQTAGVRRGDLIALLQAIQLSVHHFEIYNPNELEAAYLMCTMAAEGDNDIMMYLSVLASYIQRLEAVNRAPDDERKMFVLLGGIDQDIFVHFIAAADRKPYDSYAELQQALERMAAKNRIAAQLKALKPGQAESIHATLPIVKDPPASASARMDRIESILATLALAKGGGEGRPKSVGKCFNMRDYGKCALGDKCRFSHGSGGEQSQAAPASHCIKHGKCSHSTEDCNLLKANPVLKARLQDETRSKHSSDRPAGQNIHGTTGDSENGEAFIYATLVNRSTSSAAEVVCSMLPGHMFATRASPAKIDMWCVDGAATSMATWDRARCFNIRECNVEITSTSSEVDANAMVCREVGDTKIHTYDAATGEVAVVVLTNVLISTAFPFHIFSEIAAFDRGISCEKKKGSWLFKSGGKFVLHASQRMLNKSSKADSKLYWVDPGLTSPACVASPSPSHVLEAERPCPPLARRWWTAPILYLQGAALPRSTCAPAVRTSR